MDREVNTAATDTAFASPWPRFASITPVFAGHLPLLGKEWPRGVKGDDPAASRGARLARLFREQNVQVRHHHLLAKSGEGLPVFTYRCPGPGGNHDQVEGSALQPVAACAGWPERHNCNTRRPLFGSTIAAVAVLAALIPVCWDQAHTRPPPTLTPEGETVLRKVTSSCRLVYCSCGGIGRRDSLVSYSCPASPAG